MTTPQRNESEFGALLSQISAEHESGQRALHSFAYGTAQHRFTAVRGSLDPIYEPRRSILILQRKRLNLLTNRCISARMERMHALHVLLAEQVGSEDEASRMISDHLGQEPKGGQP